MTLVATKTDIIFVSFPVIYFSHRRSACIKNLFKNVDGSAQKPREEPLPDQVGNFGTPWRPFRIFEVLIEEMIESKNLFSESCLKHPKT